MADVKLTFLVPRNEIPALFEMMEAEDTPKCELRIKKSNASEALRDIVTDSNKRINVREIEILTDAENTGYFRETLGGGVGND